MNNIVFLQDLAVVMVAAGVAALVCHWLKQPMVLGYIVAGLVIGPHMPYWSLVSNEMSVLTLADIGVIFLMFFMGAEFNLRKLTAVGLPAVAIACADVVFMLWLGFMLGRLLGWSTIESLFLGAIICDSSTTVLARILHDMGHARERYAALIIAASLVEDLVAIALIAVLTGVGITGTVQPEEVMMRMGELLTFLVALVLAGFVVVRRVVNYVARFQSDELLLILVLAVCFSVSLLAVHFQFSLALGAFIVGAVIAETQPAERIAHFIRPIRDVFAPMFFVSIGMLIDPVVVGGHAWTIALLAAAVILGKIAGSSFGAFASGNDRETSFRIGCGMAQICEFALIIAALGASLKITGDYVYSVTVVVSVITIFLNPYLLRNAEGLFKGLDAVVPQRLAGAMTFYTRWLKHTLRRRVEGPVIKLVRRSLITIGVNLALMTAVFITVTLLARYDDRLPFRVPSWLGGTGALLWLGGALVTVPIYVATIRKIEALTMVAAEMRFPLNTGDPHASIARTLSQKVLFFAGATLLAVYTLMLSSALMPPLPVLLIMVVLLVAVTALFWKFQIRLYSRAQNLLMETFAQPETPLYVEPMTAMPYVFREAQISAAIIAADSAAANKTIRNLKLRTHTGATIVGIERGGAMIVNPDLDETIRVGDKLMLLGVHTQIENACRLLEKK